VHPTIFALKRAYQATRTSLDEELEPYGLTAAQLDVLIALKGSDSIEQRDLQEALGVSSATLARMLSNMEQRSLISRKESPDDSRRNIVSIQEDGLDLLVTLEEQEEEAFTEQFLDGLSHTDAARLNRLLNRIADTMGDTSRDIYR
jgi:DNA-binding MarR family transcriptional regulator